MKTEEKNNKWHIFTIAARVLVALAALAFAFKGKDIGTLWANLKNLNPLIFAWAVGLYLIGQIFFVLRWRIILAVQKVAITLWTGLKLHFVGLFYNNCLPGAVGGDLLRAWYITHHAPKGRKVESALSVFVDRIVGLTGMIFMALLFLFLVPVSSQFEEKMARKGPSGGHHSEFLEYSSWAAAAIIAIFALLGLLYCIPFFRKRIKSLIAGFWHKIWSIVLKLFKASKLYLTSPLSVVSAYLMTFLCQGISIVGFYLIGRDLGMHAPIKYYFVFFPVMWMAGAVPVSVGGLGIMEAALSEMFLTLPGVTEEQALAIAVCQRLVLLISSLIGLGVHICGAHLPSRKEDIFVDDSVLSA